MYKLNVELDINSELFPVAVGENYSIKLADSISDETNETDYFSVAGADSAFMEEHDYVMHGRVFKYALDKENEDMM